MYNIIFHTYSGMPIPIAENVDKQELNNKVRELNKAARKRGQIVTYLGNGKWEHETAEDAFMISDNDGFLCVRRTK